MVDDRTRMVFSGTSLRICTSLLPFDKSRRQRADPDFRTKRLAPEVANVRPFWSYVGGAAGGAIGYIVGNIPGAAAGGTSPFSLCFLNLMLIPVWIALAGNRLGAVRDAKGKSVAQVFAGLGAGQKAEVSRVCVVLGFVRG
jgi:hypothetical protein